jgi:hypothetical protein
MGAKKGNKNALNNEGGKPPVFTNPIELEKKIQDYFSECKKKRKSLTICGLTLYLGFKNRQSLSDYEKKEEFSDIIKKARLTVEENYELKLSGKCVAGAIFALKNMGWTDKQEIEHGGKIESPLPDLSKLSDQEKEQLIEIYRKLRQA